MLAFKEPAVYSQAKKFSILEFLMELSVPWCRRPSIAVSLRKSSLLWLSRHLSSEGLTVDPALQTAVFCKMTQYCVRRKDGLS